MPRAAEELDDPTVKWCVHRSSGDWASLMLEIGQTTPSPLLQRRRKKRILFYAIRAGGTIPACVLPTRRRRTEAAVE
jgi:hypothetical protein